MSVSLRTPGYRVFIFGVEVTADVTSLKINKNDARMPGTCEFVLTNAHDRYVITPQDIPLLYADVDLSVFQTRAPARDAANASNIDAWMSGLGVSGDANEIEQDAIEALAEQVITRLADVPDEVKRRVLTEKVKYFEKVDQPTFESLTDASDVEAALKITGYAKRYPLRAGDRIWHSNDAVRVFERDSETGRWHFAFAGFVSDTTDEVSENNEKIVTVRCEGPLRITRYARVAMNPGIFDIGAVSVIDDAVVRSFYNSVGFTDLSLSEYIFTIFFGSDMAGTTENTRIPGKKSFPGARLPYDRISVNGRAPGKLAADGVGAFDFRRSAICLLGPEVSPAKDAKPERPTSAQLKAKEIPLTSIADYQALLDTEVRRSSPRVLFLRSDDPDADLFPEARFEEMEIDDVVSEIGENPHIYPVDHGAVFLLLPGSLGPSTNRKVLEIDLIQSVATETTFRTRMDMIFDIINRIQFSMFETPRGDIVIEPPLYNLDPVDFGTERLRGSELAVRFRGTEVLFGLDDDDVVEPYAQTLTFRRKDIGSRQTTFSDEKVRTIYTSSWQPIQAYAGTDPSVKLGMQPSRQILFSLLPQFGARMEQSDAVSFIASPEAAALYCEIKLSQINADAISTQVELLPRARLLPNRPIEIMTGDDVKTADRMFIATTRSVDTSYTWGSEFSMSVGVNYQRAWAGQIRTDGRPLYEGLGGAAGQTLDYATLFKPRPRIPDKEPAAEPGAPKKAKPR